MMKINCPILLLLPLLDTPTLAADSRPNIILIFTDDQGFGSSTIKTPNLDRMAEEGVRLTSFYAQPVCGVSRAALITGCYPIRIAEPSNKKLLHTVPHPKETTMAEVLKNASYATGMISIEARPLYRFTRPAVVAMVMQDKAFAPKIVEMSKTPVSVSVE